MTHHRIERWTHLPNLATPLFALAATKTERPTAAGRAPMTALRRVWYGKDLERPTYYISGTLFLRLLGVVYLIAFVSLGTQIGGLVGDHGILPAKDFLAAVEQYFSHQDPPVSPVWRVPTLAWMSPHDGFLHAMCAAGTLLSLLLLLGILQMPALILLWILYLSLVHIGQVFLSFQWDILLLETGLIAIFVAPLALRSRWLADRHPPRLAIWLLWWLLFRLMFESGAVKLTWNDPLVGADGSPPANTWELLTALDYHYWTQPLPLWTSWYAAKLPSWFQKFSVVAVLFIELVLPWFIFGPRLARYVAFGGISLLMLLIAATGNYNFFNLLTFAIALTLLDDRAWPRFLRIRIAAGDSLKCPQTIRPLSHGPCHIDTVPIATAHPQRAPSKFSAFLPTTRWRTVLLVPFAAFTIVQGTLQLTQAVAPAAAPGPLTTLSRSISQFFLVNDYGLFRRMTEMRPEIAIEASTDGIEWRPYRFRWKPGDPARPPRCNTPHQPRLDWQMWFEALRLEQVYNATGTVDPRNMSAWFQSFLMRLLTAEPSVLRLLADDPVHGARPKCIRIALYQYRFTTAAERRATGDWWHRELLWRGPSWSGSP